MRQQCNGGILPPPSARAIAACLYYHGVKMSAPPLLDADALAAEAGCLRYIAGAKNDTLVSPEAPVCTVTAICTGENETGKPAPVPHYAGAKNGTPFI